MNVPRPPQIRPEECTVSIAGETALAPCVSVVLCLDETDGPGIQEFHDLGLSALGLAATHYRANEMSSRARVTARVRSQLQTWLARPSPGKSYYLAYYGCDDARGVTAAGLSVDLVPRSFAGKPVGHHERWLASWARMAEQGADVRRLLPCTVLRLTLPLDHPLAEPAALGRWVANLRLVQSGEFASGYAGYALNRHESVVAEDVKVPMNERLAALSLRHPGFDWHNTYVIQNRLLPYDVATRDFVPLVKRVNWLTLLSARAVARLDGADRVAHRLRGAPDVAVVPLDGGGLLLRAGPAPQLGDLAAGDTISAYRAVAAVVRPVRLDAIDGPGEGFPDDRAQEWLDAFDTEITG